MKKVAAEPYRDIDFSRAKRGVLVKPAQVERLRTEAQRLGLTPEDLARAAIVDLLVNPGDDFKAAAERVLRKNEGWESRAVV